jgi:hypothetical protein
MSHAAGVGKLRAPFVLAWFLALPTAAADGPLLTSATNYPVGVAPTSVAIGDLNGDGLPDLAVANHGSITGTVSVLLGTGAGGFGPATNFSVGSGNPNSVAIGDLNGDGALDLVTASSPNRVAVLLGTGTGSFNAAIPFVLLANNLSFVATADLNGDGLSDVVAVDPAQAKVFVMPSLGDGHFGQVTTVPGFFSPRGVAIGDLNGDGVPDLAVANGSVSVLLGTGAGQFGPPTNFTAPGAVSVAIGDLNGDGFQDLAAARFLGTEYRSCWARGRASLARRPASLWGWNPYPSRSLI